MPPASRPLAKLTRPRLMRPMARERLFASLDAARRSSNAVGVVGPPGAGKTSLVASWLDARQIKGIWYRFDASDDDPATFFHYLGLAVDQMGPRRRRPMPALTAEYAQDLPGFSRRFFRELFTRLPDRASIAFDNFQELAPDGSVPAIVAEAVGEVPAGLTLLVLSRAELPDCFARWRVAEALAQIEGDSLRMTSDEVRALAAARGVPDIDRLRGLVDRCGGWAAGLTLMLEGGGSTTDVGMAGDETALDRVFAFLADQVFDGMSADEQTFLIQTAQLPSMTAAMAQSLSGNPRAGEILRSLHRRQLFTHRTQGSDQHFQYHALFRDFLDRRAADALGEEGLAGLRRRAGRVCSESGLTDDAVDLCVQAHAWGDVVALLEVHIDALLAQGRTARLRRWLDRMPPAVIAANAALQYAAGSVAAAREPAVAIASLESAYRLYAAKSDGAGCLLCAAAVVEVIFYATSDHRAMVPWIDILSRSLEAPPVKLDADLALRARAALLIASLFAHPVEPGLSLAAERTLALLGQAATVSRQLMASVHLLIYATFTGRFDLAPALCAQGDALAHDAAATPYGRAHWLLWKTYLFRLQGRYADGVVAAEQAAEIAETEGFRQVGFLAAYFRNGIEAAHGHFERADRFESRARQLVDPSRSLQAALLAASSAWRALYARRWTEAVAHGERAMQVARSLAAPSYRIHYGIPYVVGLIESGSTEAARAVLDEQRRAISGTALQCFGPLLTAVEARLAEHAGDTARARQLVTDLWHAAADRESGRYLSWLKPWMSRYADWGLYDGIEPEFIRAMISDYGWEPEPLCSEHWPWPVRVRTLGSFEVTVDGAPLQFGRKTPRRPLDLLRALIARGGGVAEHTLADHFWPDDEADAARKALGAAVHRLRGLLGRFDAIVLKGGRVSLNAKVVWVDAEAFDALLSAGRGASTSDDIELFSRRARDLYRGPFLDGSRDDPWILSTRERLRGRFLQLVESSARSLEADARASEAIEWYERGIEVDELAEAFHHGLIRGLASQGRPADAIHAYRRLQRVLSRSFGRAPSPAVEALFLSLVAAD